jgi:hypothetical protein
MAELRHGQGAAAAGQPIRIAKKFSSQLTSQANEIGPFQLITVDGTLEIAPAIGYVDPFATSYRVSPTR